MEYNQKKLSKKPIPSTCNVDIDNLVKFVLVSSEETSIDHGVTLLELTNPLKSCQSENLLWQQFHL
jgi:hypothetical protein